MPTIYPDDVSIAERERVLRKYELTAWPPNPHPGAGDQWGLNRREWVGAWRPHGYGHTPGGRSRPTENLRAALRAAGINPDAKSTALSPDEQALRAAILRTAPTRGTTSDARIRDALTHVAIDPDADPDTLSPAQQALRTKILRASQLTGGFAIVQAGARAPRAKPKHYISDETGGMVTTGFQTEAFPPNGSQQLVVPIPTPAYLVSMWANGGSGSAYILLSASIDGLGTFVSMNGRDSNGNFGPVSTPIDLFVDGTVALRLTASNPEGIAKSFSFAAGVIYKTARLAP